MCSSTFLFLIVAMALLGRSQSSKYTNKWAVKIEGGELVARKVADKHGFHYLGKILEDYYYLQHDNLSKRSLYSSSFHHRSLYAEPNVQWVQQQEVKKRDKRHISLPQQKHNAYNVLQPNDPKWNKMWYLNQENGQDMNVMRAWNQNLTGEGVVVTILDDGIERNHPDLQNNYDERASYDVNSHDPDPMPRYDFANTNRHGTRSAGVVAAQRSNGICGVGVAYNAKIGGIRMLDGDVTDTVEAQSLSLNPDYIDIYTSGWGPDDDGRTVDGPGFLTKKAIYDGIHKGRGGLGSIYVWASGNGGRDGDDCNCDGYSSDIYTVSVSSVTEHGQIPWYSEPCSSVLASTYSSGSNTEKQIITTDIRHACTESHTGTTASAPLASGICALALQANPNLTWRDLQHIVVLTAKRRNLEDKNWKLNGVNRYVSNYFGYGLMDAEAMVNLAKNWSTVPDQHVCEVRLTDKSNISANGYGNVEVPLLSDGCADTVNHVQYLEHVQARITLTARRRGDIQIFLTSPTLTRSTLLRRRKRDISPEGFNNWPFVTTHNWGEEAHGQWVLEIHSSGSEFELKDFVLVLMGTATLPQNISIENRDMILNCARKLPSDDNCTLCRPGFYNLEGSCVASCPEFYYGTAEIMQDRRQGNVQYQNVCNPCHPACRTCTGPNMKDCLQCNEEYKSYCHKKTSDSHNTHEQNFFVLNLLVGIAISLLLLMLLAIMT